MTYLKLLAQDSLFVLASSPANPGKFYEIEKDMEKILKLIEAGDEDVILSQKDKIKKLQVLINYDLVSVKDEKLLLTKKGAIAIKTGVDAYFKKDPLKERTESSYCTKMETYIRQWDRKRKISFTVWILLLLVGILLRHSIT